MKLRFRDLDHVREQTRKRVPASDVNSFVSAVMTGFKPVWAEGRVGWALRVIRKSSHKDLGLAVGEGWVWHTTISAGMRPQDPSTHADLPAERIFKIYI